MVDPLHPPAEEGGGPEQAVRPAGDGAEDQLFRQRCGQILSQRGLANPHPTDAMSPDASGPGHAQAHETHPRHQLPHPLVSHTHEYDVLRYWAGKISTLWLYV